MDDLPKPDAWLKSGEYLPEFMRDFHDQKDLFKALQPIMQRSVDGGNTYLENMNWTMAHIYVVDVFLWCLARRGYTLQKSKKKLDFEDIYEFIG